MGNESNFKVYATGVFTFEKVSFIVTILLYRSCENKSEHQSGEENFEIGFIKIRPVWKSHSAI